MLVDSHLCAGKDPADGAAGGTKRVVQADERSGFRHAVTLNDRVTEPLPKCLYFFRQRGAARDDSPKFPAEAGANATESPPARQKMFFLAGSEIAAKARRPALAFQLPFDPSLKQLKESGNCDQNGNPFLPNRRSQFGRL